VQGAIVGNTSETVNVTLTDADLTVSLSPVTLGNPTITSGYDILVTWDDPDPNPFARYEVSYTVKTADDYSNTGYAYATTPAPTVIFSQNDLPYQLISATTNTYDVSVRKVIEKKDANSPKLVYFHTPSAAASKEVTVFDPNANYVYGNSSLTATRDTSNNSVRITIPATAMGSLVVPIGQIEFFRTELAYDGSAAAAGTPVATAGARLIDQSSTLYYELYDTLTANDNNRYLYRAIIKYPASSANSDAIYQVYYGYLAIQPTPAPGPLMLQALNLASSVLITTLADNATVDNATAYVQLRYNYDSSVDYKVYRKQTSLPNLVTVPSSTIFDWELITPTDDTSVAQTPSIRVVKSDIPKARTSYSYKVVASKAGYTGTEDTVTSISFRSRITSNGGTEVDTDSYPWTVNQPNSWTVSSGNGLTRYTNTDASYDVTSYIYSVNINGLASADIVVGGVTTGTRPVLRAGESLRIEFIPKGGATAIAPVLLTLGTTWTGQTEATGTINTQAFYFVVPEPTNGYYDFRLLVTVP